MSSKIIKVNRKELMNTLAVAGSMAGRNKFVPIYECIKVMVTGQSARIVSFNGEVAVSVKCPLLENNAGDFSFCVNARDFSAYVRLITDDDVTVSVSESEGEDTKICEISHSKGKTTIPYEDADLFPNPATEDNYSRIVIGGGMLLDALAISQNFVASDALRPIMGCMYMELDKGTFCYCASDSHILVVEDMPYEGESGEKVTALIHSSAFKPLMDILKDSKDVSLRIGKQTVIISNGDASINCRITDGKYPNFRSIIPASFGMTVSGLPTRDVIAAVERCSLCSSTTSALKFSFIAGKGIEISCRDLDFGKEAKEFVPCEVGQDMEVGFNSGYFLSVLKAVKDDTFSMLINSPSHAAIIRDGNENKNILIMPVRLQN